MSLNGKHEGRAFVVQSGVPLPPRAGKTGGGKYPWDEMAVGDCFDAPAKNGNTMSTIAAKSGRQHGRKYTVRKIGEGLYRIWRIA